MDWPFSPALYIEHDKDLKKLVKTLRNERLLAFDTESNSLYAYRERVCLIQLSTRDRDYIIDPLRIAEAAPRSTNELEHVRGLPVAIARRYTQELLQAVERGKHTQLPHRPRRTPDIDPVVAERFTALRDWRRERAESRGVESDVILSKDAMWGVAIKAPTTLDDLQGIRGIGPWRLVTYGQEIVALMTRLRAEEL